MSNNINRLIHLAYSQEGVKEESGNQVKYNDDYYGHHVKDYYDKKEDDWIEYHWCAVFVWWLFTRSGNQAAIDYIGKKSSAESVSTFRDRFQNRKVALEDVKAGDLMILKYGGGGGHMGLVVEDYDPSTGSVLTIEGNTSPQGAIGAADRNGDGVYLKRRSTLPPKGFIGGFYARPFWENVETPAIPNVGQPMGEFPLSPGWVFAKSGYQSYNGKGDGYAPYVEMIQEALVSAGYNISVDGAFGNNTHNALVSFQRSKGLSADGKVGRNTWNALRAVRDGGSGSSTRFPLPKGHCYGKSGWGNHNGYDGNSEDKRNIKKIQSFLGIGADGLFGSGTHRAVVKFQRAHGLDADGKVGPSTWKAMFG